MENRTFDRILNRLRILRHKHSLTQEMFAEVSGISYKYYQAIEAGRKRELCLSTLERLAAVYDVEVYQLLAPSSPKTRVQKKPRRKNERSLSLPS